KTVQRELFQPELAIRGLRATPALPLWLKLVELNSLPESRRLGYVFAGQKTLARELGYSPKPIINGVPTYKNGAKTVRCQFVDLHALGLVSRIVRIGRGHNHYYLDPEAVNATRRIYCASEGTQMSPHIPSEGTQMSPEMSPVYTEDDLKEEEENIT